MWDPYAGFESRILANGLEVHALHIPEREWSSIMFQFHAGASQDPEGLEGTAHFVEHVVSRMFYETCEDFVEYLEEQGGDINDMATDLFGTNYHFSVPAIEGVLETLIKHLVRILRTELGDELIESERKIILNELYTKYPLKSEFSRAEKKRSLLYHDFWLERFPIGAIGTPRSISRITKRDLQQFIERYYVPANFSIVSVGLLHVDELSEAFFNFGFGSDRIGVRVPIGQPIDIICPLRRNRLEYESLKDCDKRPTRSETQYWSSVRIPGRCSRYAVVILCLMMRSMLMKTIRRERSAAYEIACTWTNYQGLYEYSIVAPSISPSFLPTFEALIQSAIDDLGFDDALFESRKRKLMSSLHTADLKLGEICENAAFSLLINGRIETHQTRHSHYEQVTLEDIRSLLEWFQPHRRLTVVLHP